MFSCITNTPPLPLYNFFVDSILFSHEFCTQVIALDKIEKSSRHIAQNILPRVKVFDHESVKKAIDSITSHQGKEVIYAASEVISKEFQHSQFHMSLALALFLYPVNWTLLCFNQFVLNDVSKTKVHHANLMTNKTRGPSSPKCPVRTASKIKPRTSIGHVEFANIMRQKYPNMVPHHNQPFIYCITQFRFSTPPSNCSLFSCRQMT